MIDKDKQFAQFWQKTNENWRSLSVKERNFRRSIGLKPDKEVSRIVFMALKNLPPAQMVIQLDNPAM